MEIEDGDYKQIEEFIRTAVYTGKSNEDYVDTRVRLYKNLKVKSSMPLPPDPLSVIQVIRRAHHQAYTWFHCGDPIIAHLALEDNGWSVKEQEVKPIWFVGSQFPPSALKRTTNKEKDGSEADDESEEEQPPKKKTRRTSSKFKEKTPACESDNHKLPLETMPIPSGFIDLGDEGDIDSDGFATEGTSVNRKSESEWEVSDFWSSGDSCDEWLP